jgi:hypothetical protein
LFAELESALDESTKALA